MSEVTSNLKLFKYDVVEDAKQPFSIERALNDNWDLLDSKVVRKTGDTMTGDLIINKPTNSWPTINFIGKGTMGETSDTVQYGARILSRDAKNQYFATYEQAIAENGRSRAYMVVRSTNDDGATYSNRRLEVTCNPDGSGGTYIDGKLVKTFVTQIYSNGTSWYRVWSDGWIEQGGFIKTTVAANRVETLTFLKAFTQTGYTAVISDYAYSANDTTQGASGNVKIWGTTGYTTTGMSVISSDGVGRAASWYVCGY